MSSTWKYQAHRLKQIIDSNNETHAHLYMEKLLLFPIDIQDKIIEDISHLPDCNNAAVANILGHYSIRELK